MPVPVATNIASIFGFRRLVTVEPDSRNKFGSRTFRPIGSVTNTFVPGAAVHKNSEHRP